MAPEPPPVDNAAENSRKTLPQPSQPANPAPWNPNREKRRLQFLTRLYGVGLTLIAILILSCQYMLTTSSNRERDIMTTQNNIRRLERRSSEMFRSIEVLAHLGRPDDYPEYLTRARNANLNLQKSVHCLDSTTSPLHRILEQDKRGPEIITTTRAILSTLQHGLTTLTQTTTSPPNLNAVHTVAQEILLLEPQLLSASKRALEICDQQRNAIRGTTRSIEISTVLAVIGLLIAEVLLIFRPASQRILKITDRLFKANSDNLQLARRLQSAATELTARNQELEQSLHTIHQLHHALLAQSEPVAFGTVARGMAQQMQPTLRTLENNLEDCLNLSADFERILRIGSSRIPLRTLDELQDISTNIAARLSTQTDRIQSLQRLISVCIKFVERNDTPNTNRSVATQSTIPLPLLPLTEEAVALFRTGGEETDPQLGHIPSNDSTNAPDPEIILEVDDDLITHAPRRLIITCLVQLLTNAARATRLRQIHGPAPEGYHRIIGISATADPDSPRGIILRIMDNGVGMTPDIRLQAYQPFFTTKPGGLGMGLTHVHDFIVGELQGKVELIDTPGGGTTVRLTIPAN